MNKLFLILFSVAILLAGLMAPQAEAQTKSMQKIETQGQAVSIWFSFMFDAKTIEVYREMAIEQAKGESMLRANEICEEQMHGHLFLNARLFAPEQCLMVGKTSTTAEFHCSIAAVNECEL